jgi:hypothetical protein
MAPHQVLFCPFCREGFAERSTCPAHELVLVPLERLPSASEDEEREPAELPNESLSLFDARHGRGLVAAGSVLLGAALALDFVRFGDAVVRSHELARAQPSLWTLGLVAFTALYALARRRTAAAMRGLRVLVPALALLPVITVCWTFHRRVPEHATLGSAVYVVALGSLLLFVGGVQLGGGRQ